MIYLVVCFSRNGPIRNVKMLMLLLLSVLGEKFDLKQNKGTQWEFPKINNK